STPNLTFGQPLTVVVMVGTSAPFPTGTVTILDNGTPLGTAPIDATGTATFTTAGPLTPGVHTITETYPGDSLYAGHGPTTIATLTVVQAPTSATVPGSSVMPRSAQPITFTVSIAGSVPPGVTPPTGTVTFLDGTTILGTAALNASGTVTFTTTGP